MIMLINTLNDYIPILLIVNLVIFLFGFIVLNKLGGIAKNFPFFINFAFYIIINKIDTLLSYSLHKFNNSGFYL